MDRGRNDTRKEGPRPRPRSSVAERAGADSGARRDRPRPLRYCGRHAPRELPAARRGLRSGADSARAQRQPDERARPRGLSRIPRRDIPDDLRLGDDSAARRAPARRRAARSARSGARKGRGGVQPRRPHRRLPHSGARPVGLPPARDRPPRRRLLRFV